MILNALDLFSGIGGFSLGLERTGGFRTVAFCEVDSYCQKVLRQHWPNVPIHDDVRRLNAAGLMEHIDVVCGGFPCQDISFAGQGAGLSGARSGLWFEMFRIIAETRPSYVIIENVAALRSRGLDVVLGCLASIGYDAEWHCIPAAAVGAPHRRDRVWIIAYDTDSVGSRLAQPIRTGETLSRTGQSQPAGLDSGDSFLADADSPRLAFGQGEPGGARPKLTAIKRADWWLVEPDVGRVANGIPARVDRLRALGNSIVPQIVEQIGAAILYHEALHG